jgi:fluoride exporter
MTIARERSARDAPFKTNEKRAESPIRTGLTRRALSEIGMKGKRVTCCFMASGLMALAMNMTSPLLATAYVALGGAAGSVARYQLGRLMTLWLGPQAMGAFPFATLAVNTIGSLAMGLLAGALLRLGGETDGWRLLVGVGLLGGFTTFSAFSLETAMLIQRGQVGIAGVYALLSLGLGVSGLLLGLNLTRIGA